MRTNRPAQTYAEAAYEAATNVWLQALTALQQALEKNPRVFADLRDPSTALADKQALVAPLLPDDAPQEVRNFVAVLLFVSVLLSCNDIGLLTEITELFRRLAARNPRAQIVRVTSAVPLTDDEKHALAERLAAQFGENLEFDYREDPSILGGLIIRVGDRVIDASVAGKLEALRKTLVARE